MNWQEISALAHAAAAFAIVGLTVALVRTTRHYTDETKRMADQMFRAHSHDAAERIGAALVAFRHELVRIPSAVRADPNAQEPAADNTRPREAGRVITDLATALQRDGQALMDGELRDRVDVFNAVAWLACLHIASGDEGDARMRQRVSRAAAQLKSDLDAYRRGDDISRRLLPLSRQHDQLEAFLSRRH